MIVACLDAGKKVLCEKPPIISVKDYYELLKHPNIDDLSIVFQCRYADKIKEIGREIFESNRTDLIIDVYRDEWYMKSWKADKERSGGLVYNIGCHYMDILAEYLGHPTSSEVTHKTDRKVKGILKFGDKTVHWMISIEATNDMQKRLIKTDNKEYNLTQLGFESLHGKVYEEFMAGRGHGLKDIEDTLKLIEKI